MSVVQGLAFAAILAPIAFGAHQRAHTIGICSKQALNRSPCWLFISALWGRVAFVGFGGPRQGVRTDVGRCHCGHRAYVNTAEPEIPQGGAEGMLVTQGGRFGAWPHLHSTAQAAASAGGPHQRAQS